MSGFIVIKGSNMSVLASKFSVVDHLQGPDHLQPLPFGDYWF